MKPSSLLANIVDMAKRMNDQAMKEAAVWRVCERHKKPLKFFCKDDEATLCATCTTMKRHKTHHVLLVEDAAEDDKVCSILGLRTGNVTVNFHCMERRLVLLGKR